MGNSAPKGTKTSSKGKNVGQLRSQFAQMEKQHTKNQNTLVKKSKSKPKPKPKPKPKQKAKLSKPKPQPKPKPAKPISAPKTQAPPPAAGGVASKWKNNNNNNNNSYNSAKKPVASGSSNKGPTKTTYTVKKWGNNNGSNNSKPVNSVSTGKSQYVSENAHGFTKEQQLKQVFKYDFAKEKVVIDWISSVSGCRVSGQGPDKLQSQLEDGVILCKLINSILKEKVVPDSMMRSKNPYAKNERIGKFSEQSKKVLYNAPFEVNDLHNPSGHVNMTAVVDGLYSLGLACNKSNKINVTKMKMPKANTGNRMDV